MENNEKSVTFTLQEAATFLGISRSACYLAAKSGQLPVIRIGKRMLISRIALEHLLATPAPANWPE